MKTASLYYSLNKLRLVIVLVGLSALMFGTWKTHAHVVDIEPPSGEARIAEDRYQNEQNEKAYDRCMERDENGNSKGSERDWERAETYIRENVV